MAKAIRESVVEYNGDLEGLVIKVNGEIVYSAKLKKAAKSDIFIKAQEDHAAATKFAKCVNQIPILASIWKDNRQTRWGLNNKVNREFRQNSKFGRPSAFNKIISANKKQIRVKGIPSIMNLMLPESCSNFPYEHCGELNEGGVEIELHVVNRDKKAFPDNSTIIPCGVFCFHEPRKAGKPKFEMLSKFYEINDFVESENYKIHFPISEEEIKTIKNYKKCIFYFAIGTPPEGEKRARGFKHGHGSELSIENYPKKSIKFGKG